MTPEYRKLLSIYRESRQKGYTTAMIRSLRGGEIVVVPYEPMRTTMLEMIDDWARWSGFDPKSITIITPRQADQIQGTDRPIVIDKSIWEVALEGFDA